MIREKNYVGKYIKNNKAVSANLELNDKLNSILSRLNELILAKECSDKEAKTFLKSLSCMEMSTFAVTSELIECLLTLSKEETIKILKIIDNQLDTGILADERVIRTEIKEKEEGKDTKKTTIIEYQKHQFSIKDIITCANSLHSNILHYSKSDIDYFENRNRDYYQYLLDFININDQDIRNKVLMEYRDWYQKLLPYTNDSKIMMIYNLLSSQEEYVLSKLRTYLRFIINKLDAEKEKEIELYTCSSKKKNIEFNRKKKRSIKIESSYM